MKIVVLVASAFLIGGAAGAVTTSLAGSSPGADGAYCVSPVAAKSAPQENPWKNSGESKSSYSFRFARSAGAGSAGW